MTLWKNYDGNLIQGSLITLYCPTSFFKDLVNYLYFSVFEKEQYILHCHVLKTQKLRNIVFFKEN